MAPVVYLVSGANRGLGFGIVAALVARDNVVVFAGVRNPSSADALTNLGAKHPGKLHIVQLTSADKADNERAVAEITAKVGRLDAVIANAGILSWVGPSVEAPVNEVARHFEVNAIGPLVLFQATFPLLKASTASPKFAIISSLGGSITVGTEIPFGFLPYGMSKAAVNYVAKKLHVEYANDGLVSFSIEPGPTMTDMLTALDGGSFVPPDILPPDEVGRRIAKLVEEATRENASGQFIEHTGKKIEW
ncbi:NAD(P)-binding protein [Punctularia strigosozonata HHB-11173 SS5]|uniref:NAD(P)-binding protein n=1 Tax=Punctularia strigosozonata (strain HHB-11173) TaxID=741275 RepID=UPI0004416F19|nr:NAD(P)-binding protein [Punctularia strigosozonata HHB-11173 SS5]EIN05948.1 NAD(P)-binding protein [Punctularia strigosozonata HHB-11173 SS5]